MPTYTLYTGRDGQMYLADSDVSLPPNHWCTTLVGETREAAFLDFIKARYEARNPRALRMEPTATPGIFHPVWGTMHPRLDGSATECAARGQAWYGPIVASDWYGTLPGMKRGGERMR